MRISIKRRELLSAGTAGVVSALLRLGVLLLGVGAWAPILAAEPALVPAIISDPPPDSAHPAGMVALVVPSQGFMMNAVLYTASGVGPHPTLLLIHGLPGNEENLDLAQAVRRAGWNVLTYHPRGSWGSEGTYSIANTISDARAALTFLRDPENAKYGIDPDRIVAVGHSMGGYDAAALARTDHHLLGVVLIDAWGVAPSQPPTPTDWYSERYRTLDKYRLKAESADSLSEETVRFETQEPVVSFARDLAKLPCLIVAGDIPEKTNGVANHQLADILASYGEPRSKAVFMTTDHFFSDHRIELISVVVDWLRLLLK